MRVRHLTTLTRKDAAPLGVSGKLRSWGIDAGSPLPEWADVENPPHTRGRSPGGLPAPSKRRFLGASAHFVLGCTPTQFGSGD